MSASASASRRQDQEASEEELVSPSEKSQSPTSTSRRRSTRAAALKANRASAKQARSEDSPVDENVNGNEDESESESEYEGKDEDEREDTRSEIDLESESGNREEGILSNSEGERWLKVGEPFPWEEVEWYLDESIEEDMRTHLGKRIDKMKGSQTLDPEQADLLLINPHPNRINHDRSKHLCGLGHVQRKLARVIPYDWLSKCYFTKHVEPPPSPSVQPIFLEEKGKGLRVAVLKLGEGVDGDKLRRSVMVDLETNGAMIVSSPINADVVILPPSHPYITTPPKQDELKHIIWRTPDWVREKIKMARHVPKSKANPKLSKGESRSNDKSNPKTRPNLKSVKSKSAVNRGRSRSDSSDDSESDSEELGPSQRRTTSRTEFTPSDRDFLARWLAYHRPDQVGRTTRSLYKRLEVNIILSPPLCIIYIFNKNSLSHPFFKHASRHPHSAWHEHFKRNRSKLGMDGKVLEDLVDEYVDKGIDRRLKTRMERKGKGKEKPTAGKLREEENDEGSEYEDDDGPETRTAEKKGGEKRKIVRGARKVTSPTKLGDGNAMQHSERSHSEIPVVNDNPEDENADLRVEVGDENSDGHGNDPEGGNQHQDVDPLQVDHTNNGDQGEDENMDKHVTGQEEVVVASGREDLEVVIEASEASFQTTSNESGLMENPAIEGVSDASHEGNEAEVDQDGNEKEGRKIKGRNEVKLVHVRSLQGEGEEEAVGTQRRSKRLRRV
ncbi:hypothetical protein L486_01740 [Kwoniella mangroviensis CBS 10435]|uniref:BRCT domain-containing protein n=1 Tax=Kwoniella mangroviensis CBS 10435 TaxID=1331196 RepID=A0A1B9J335_9TREE|nr:hypothetical protein L486_01740 [Kwoniella mangroviensis CBS 10435]